MPIGINFTDLNDKQLNICCVITCVIMVLILVIAILIGVIFS